MTLLTNAINVEKIFFILMALFFLSWFFLSILNQFRFKFMFKVLNYDYFHLLPFWTFFAPEPGTTDHELVFRDRSVEKINGMWKKAVYAQKHTYLFWFIDNNKYKSKIISDHQSHIIEMVNTNFTQNQLKLTFSYLSLLNFVMQFPRDNNSEQRQFTILDKNKSLGKTNFDIILASEWHNF